MDLGHLKAMESLGRKKVPVIGQRKVEIIVENHRKMNALFV